eukprot:scaffold3592_cov61-Phaeocystis_antarctica.AAC.2
MGTKPAKVAHRPSWPTKAAKPGLFPDRPTPKTFLQKVLNGWLHFHPRQKRDEWFVSRRRTSTSFWHAPTLQGASAPLS